MSSVDWKKLKGPEIDAMIYHAVRHDGKDVRYRNSYIDKERQRKDASQLCHRTSNGPSF